MKKEIFNQVKGMIGDILQRDYRSLDKLIEEDMALREDIGLDSIDLAVLQIETEDQWNIRFDPLRDDFQKIFFSVHTLCEFLELRIGEKNDRQEG